MDPTNVFGPFYNKLNPGKQIAVLLRHQISGVWHPVFRGFIDDLQFQIDYESPNVLRGTISGIDMMAKLTNAEVVPGNAGDGDPEDAGTVYYAEAHDQHQQKRADRDQG